MWALSNRTRFAAERTFARDRTGAEVFLVVVKATFAIDVEGALRVADEQVPIAMTPEHFGEPGRSSLRYEADFALGKRATDVLLLGHAHAIRGEPTIGVEVSARVGAWSKRIVAVGDRRWDQGLSGIWLTDPEPFVSMPLTFERAFGGTDDSGEESAQCDENPVGRGFVRSQRSLVGCAAPNLEDPDDLISSPRKRPRPMCLGPIAREWAPRLRLAGTFDERWMRERRPLVPDDFDDAFWQSAPKDQQVTTLEGGEEVELIGVSPRGPLRFELPRIRLSLRSKIGGEKVRHAAALHTVLFEPDHDRVVLVFQSALPCHHSIHTLRRTIIEEEALA